MFSVINVTLPDEKSNYVHRIGRVGRAERMGLAISLVSTVPEKVALYLQNYSENLIEIVCTYLKVDFCTIFTTFTYVIFRY